LFYYESSSLSIELINYSFVGAYEFEYLNHNFDDVTRTINDSYELTIKLSMQHGFNKFEGDVQIPFAFEKNKNNLVTDVYIEKLHTKIYGFFGRDVEKINGEYKWILLKDFII